MVRALRVSRIAQWLEHYGIVDSSVVRALRVSRIAKWLELCGVSQIAQWLELCGLVG